MTEETKSKEETLAELKRKIKELEDQVSAKDQEIDEFKKKEEGYLVWCSNPQYNGTTMGILFTDGMAFLPASRTYTEGSAARVVKFLESDFGYHSQFFTKDQNDELQKRISARARERAEAQARLGNPEDMLEKLLVAHRI